MEWLRPFWWQTTPNSRSRWGHHFELTPEHLTVEAMAPLKQSYDELADAVLDRLNKISPPAPFSPSSPTLDTDPLPKQLVVTAKRDIVELLREHQASDPILAQLWSEVNTAPDWVDWDQLARGQDVFYRYSGVSVYGLAFQSLLGGMGAARVVEVLARTGGFGTRVARHRLYETTQYVLQCTRDVASIAPGGDGWKASIRVRLLHAAVRQRILRLERARPGYYDVSRYGVPVNDLDSMGTIASFSSSLIWLAFPRQGIWLRQQEITDYIALWRYLAYLMGAPTAHFATPAKAKALMESLLLHEVEPSELSGTLARNVVEALSGMPPTYSSREFLSAMSRWLLGSDMCDRLGIMRPPVYYWVLVCGQCLLFMTLNYTNRSVRSWDRAKLALMRRALWRLIVESEHGLAGSLSSFDFKHVPSIGKMTAFEMGVRTVRTVRTTHGGVEADGDGTTKANSTTSRHHHHHHDNSSKEAEGSPFLPRLPRLLPQNALERKSIVTFGVFSGFLVVLALTLLRLAQALFVLTARF